MSSGLSASTEWQSTPAPRDPGPSCPRGLTEPMRKVVTSTLEVVVHEFSPHAASFFTVDETGSAHLVAAHAADRPARNLTAEVRAWVSVLDGIDPLGLTQLAAAKVPVAGFADVGGVAKVLRRPFLLAAYQRIGAVNEARILIRDDDRLVAGVTLWRSLRDAPWAASRLQHLAALQPLVERAYGTARRVRSGLSDRGPLAGLTRRQREVAALLRHGATNREIARSLGVSESTARSHTRAVLAKLGVSSRREVVLWLNQR
ncbi:MAG TPA: LuxR C-terminal-related transcriptional regulator [Solirubrobacterales bacterium]|nr:LuxR C-terminal-related transcriptional regulator [Solirubrobacterales bacterium]